MERDASDGAPRTRTPALKVSVVIPVYNPGRYLDRCIASVLRQSLAAEEFEGIFVDDGSTDGSPARLDALARERSNVRVIHQENSGWPGKPRNVGIEAARGEYVFFLDDDDALGPDALSKLYGFATRIGSDVVLGRMVGHGRHVPTNLFASTRDRVSLWDSAIVDALTPHKLFRRAFLEEHKLRFREGRRRLEDHVFVLEAYFAASTISVLSEPDCYHFFERPDVGGASHARIEPERYYGYVREEISVIEAHTDPGPARDALLSHLARLEMLNKLRGPRFLGQPTGQQAELFAAIRDVVEVHVPPSVDDRLSPFLRTQMALVRADRLDLAVALASWEQSIRCEAEVIASSQGRPGPVGLSVRARLEGDGGGFPLDRRDDRFVLDLPRGIEAIVGPLTHEVSISGQSVMALRRSADGMELPIPAQVERRFEERDGRYAAADHVQAEIDPRSLRSLPGERRTRWEVVVRMPLGGITREAVVADVRRTGPDQATVGRRFRVARVSGRGLRRYGVAAAIAVSRRLDPRLRRVLWPVGVRIVRRLERLG